MQILVLSAHLPSPRATQAGQRNTYHLCQFLASHHDLHVLSFASVKELESFQLADANLFRSFDFVRLSNSSRIRGFLASPLSPLLAAARSSGGFRRKLKSLIANVRFDVALLDYTGMLQYSSDLTRIPRVGSLEADVSFRIWERRAGEAKSRLGKFLYGVEASRTRHWELDRLSQMDFVLVHNSEERKLIEQLLPGSLVTELNVWADLGRDEEVTPYCEREANSLVFWGAMDRQENIDAATYGAERIVPRIQNQGRQISYYLAGNAPPSWLLNRYRDSLVKVCGFVENPFKFLATKQIALLPIRLGAGVKVKVLECMAAGLPVVTTPAGAEAIPGKEGKHFLVGQSEEELAALVKSLLDSPAHAAELGMQAREIVLAEHSFERSLQRIEEQVLREIPETNHECATVPA